MTTARTFLPALGAGLAFTLGGTGDKLAFQPKAGSSVTKTFVIGGEFSLDELSLIVSGQDVGGMIGDVDMSMKQENRFEVTDTYKKVGDGRPLELLRRFDELSSRMTMEMSPSPAEMPEIESASALEGKTVSFRWDEEDEEYVRAFAEGEGDLSLLDELEEDMDLRIFLPSEEVEVDESWTIELTDLKAIVMPGGNLAMLPTGADMDLEDMKVFEEIFADFGEDLGELLDGECRCTFKGAREQDGVRLAEVSIELEVASSFDMVELLDRILQKAMEESGAGDMVAFSIETAELGLDFEGSGTLLWDLGAGRVHAFQLSGDATIGLDFEVGVEAEGESQALDAELELSGTMRHELSVNE